jgi:hypothetical protein
MKNLLCILFLSVFAVKASGQKFELSKSQSKEGDAFIEIQYQTSTGKSFAQILSDISVKQDKVSVRLLGGFSPQTSKELYACYETKIPRELQAAFKASGNLHNPTLAPLIRLFPSAYKTTTVYRGIERALGKLGFTVTSIIHEKYTLYTKASPRIWVADIWLAFAKSTGDDKR